jgi:hypothetical protein
LQRLSTSFRGTSGATLVRSFYLPLTRSFTNIISQASCGPTSCSILQSCLSVPGCISAVLVRSRVWLALQHGSRKRSRRTKSTVMLPEARVVSGKLVTRRGRLCSGWMVRHVGLIIAWHSPAKTHSWDCESGVQARVRRGIDGFGTCSQASCSYFASIKVSI